MALINYALLMVTMLSLSSSRVLLLLPLVLGTGCSDADNTARTSCRQHWAELEPSVQSDAAPPADPIDEYLRFGDSLRVERFVVRAPESTEMWSPKPRISFSALLRNTSRSTVQVLGYTVYFLDQQGDTVGEASCERIADPQGCGISEPLLRPKYVSDLSASVPRGPSAARADTLGLLLNFCAYRPEDATGRAG